jgi:acetylornithine deacetylase
VALGRAVLAAAPPGVRVRFGRELPTHKRDRVPAGWPTTVVSYGSDLPFLGSWGECYQLGPGTIRVAHSDAEHIRKDDLLRGVDLYVRLATDLLAGEAA